MNHDDMPPQPKTAELPAADPVQVLLAQLKVSMDAGFAGLRADVGLVSNDLGLLKDRVVLVEKRVADGEERAARTSARVQGSSVVDLEHESQLAQERAAREELAAKVDALTASQTLQLAILGRLDKVATNPHVKLILAVLATAMMSWAASKGLK